MDRRKLRRPSPKQPVLADGTSFNWLPFGLSSLLLSPAWPLCFQARRAWGERTGEVQHWGDEIHRPPQLLPQDAGQAAPGAQAWTLAAAALAGWSRDQSLALCPRERGWGRPRGAAAVRGRGGRQLVPRCSLWEHAPQAGRQTARLAVACQVASPPCAPTRELQAGSRAYSIGRGQGG